MRSWRGTRSPGPQEGSAHQVLAGTALTQKGEGGDVMLLSHNQLVPGQCPGRGLFSGSYCWLLRRACWKGAARGCAVPAVSSIRGGLLAALLPY